MERISEKGFVLASVLGVLVLVSLIAASILLSARSSMSEVTSTITRSQLRASADGGIEAGIALLLGDPATRRLDQHPYTTTVELATRPIEIEISFEASRIDLNAADTELLRLMFVYLGLELEEATAVAARVVDWRDFDEITLPNGAERAEYIRASRTPPANRAFLTVSEVGRVLDFPLSIVPCLEHVATVYSGQRIPIMQHLPAELQSAVEAHVPAAQGSSMALTSQSSQTVAGQTFRIRSTAMGQNNQRFVREAVIRLTGDFRVPYWVLSWDRVVEEDSFSCE